MRKSRGVLTLEAALVLPIVICTMFLMIFLSLFVYTRLYIAISVNHVASIATAYWYDSNSELYTVDNNYNSVIANALGTIGSKQVKIDNLKKKIEKRIDTAPMNIVSKDVTVEAKSYLIYNKLLIKVECTYELPLGGLFDLLGLTEDGKLKDKFSKEIKFSSTEENMRLIAYLSDKVAQLYGNSKIKSEINGKLDEVINFLNKAAGNGGEDSSEG